MPFHLQIRPRQMLLNWYPVDTHFFFPGMSVKSRWAFALVCLTAFGFVLLLQALRRHARAYDRALAVRHAFRQRSIAQQGSQPPMSMRMTNVAGANPNIPSGSAPGQTVSPVSATAAPSGRNSIAEPSFGRNEAVSRQYPKSTSFQPNCAQQILRALLFTAQFVLGYLIMLLAMSLNGFVLLCIFAGAFVGFFVFQWERVWDRRGQHAVDEQDYCCA